MLAVYQKCLANYQAKQWDSGTVALFDKKMQKDIQVVLPAISCIAVNSIRYECLSECLLDAQKAGSSNDACLMDWLYTKNINALDFFEYEVSQDDTVHACQVFSGPAKLPGDVGLPFKICLEEYEASGICKLPNIVWSGRSTNKVPVGSPHATTIVDEAQRLQAAQTSYASIRKDVEDALQLMSSWDASKLNIMIFSAEGDMLHQYFDCYMMGARSKTELWPGPSNAPQPVWSRNKDGLLNRNFELPCSGEALRDRLSKRDSKSPFTCGSFSRRAAIKYFLRNVIQSDPTNNQNTVKAAVVALVDKLKKAWISDLDSYMCQCKDTGRNHPSCCVLDKLCDPSTTKCPCEDGSEPSYACCDVQCTESTFLPSKFQIIFDKIKGKDLVSTLFDQATAYLNKTIWTENKPWLLYDMGATEAYNWTQQNLQSAVDDAAFDTTQPIVQYDVSELGYPYKTTTWEHCHGLLQQVIFTMPMKDGKPTSLSDAYNPSGQSTTVNMTYREDFVRRMVQDAYKVSPMFWHYVVRHKPSDSAVCTKTKPNYIAPVNNTFLMQGFNALKLGGHGVDCYCGWWLNETHCQLPTVVCERLVLLVGATDIQTVCNMHGGVTNEQRRIHDWMDMLIQKEGGWMDWPCPSMFISDHWGIVPNQLLWLKGSSDTSLIYNYILQNGTSGLRVGSLDWMKSNVHRHINPAARVEPIQPLTCELHPPQSLVDNFVDDLFPAAQGVRQSASVSVCLRFTIELARLSAYEEAKLMVAAAEQTAIVSIWKQRCELKLKQVTFCHVFGVFNVTQDNENCPFTVSKAFDSFTVTPNCLVVWNGKVYDPCICNAKWCAFSNDVLNLFELTETCLLMHPTELVTDSLTNLPIFEDNVDQNIHPALKKSSFRHKVLMGTDNNIVNNKGHWSQAEGSSNFHYCDLVVDWWPDDWKHPVGYHVTVPCTDAAHKTFDASWSALRVGSVVKMMHTPNSLRNRTKQTNMFGAAGVCRTHNYGMPMKIMNTIRFCTQADNRAVDPTVPNSRSSEADWGTEYCSQSPFDTPWSKGPSSVGTYFNYLVHLAEYTGWGNDAGHAPFKSCVMDSDCCATCKCLLSKTNGICALLQPETFECAQHQHCIETMCAGDGRCVQPVLELHNNASFDIVARVFSDQCADTYVDTWGTSKGDNVPDILNASGMCSYRSWFEQQQLQSCSATQCLLDSTQPWMFSSTSQVPRSAFDANILKVQATSCDRDYEHYENMYSCTPSQTLLRDELGVAKSVSRGKLTRTYRSDRVLPIVKHDWSNRMLGFLGLPKQYEDLGYGTLAAPTRSPLLKPCSSFGLCADQASAGYWYVNGVNEPIRYVTVGSGATANLRAHTVDDLIDCGGMGFKDNNDCRLDPAVVPLFYIYCNNGATSYPICNKYNGGLYTRGKTVAALQTLANDLNALLTRSVSVTTWQEYLDAVNSAEELWSNLTSKSWTSSFINARVDQQYSGRYPRGLYYMMTYSAYEFPFAWWFRCTWLSNVPVGPTAVACDAWDGKTWDKTKADGSYLTSDPTLRNDKLTRKQWLAQASGVYTHANVQATRNQLHKDFIASVGQLKIPPIDFTCYNAANYIRSFDDTAYDYQVLQSVNEGTEWPPSTKYKYCKGPKECLTHSDLKVSGTKRLVEDVLNEIILPSACTSSCKCTSGVVVPQCAFAQDDVVLSSSLASVQENTESTGLPVYIIVPGSTGSFAAKYDSNDNGCDIIHCCESNLQCTNGARQYPDNQCRCFRDTPTVQEIAAAGLTPKPTVAPWVIFDTAYEASRTITASSYITSTSEYVAINICKASGKTTRCTLADPVVQDSCTGSNDAQAQSVINEYCTSSGSFSSFNDHREVCMYKLKGTEHECFGSNSIASKYIKKPSNIPLDVAIYSTPAKPCFLLDCEPTDPLFSKTSRVMYSEEEANDNIIIEVNVTQIEFKYDYRLMVFHKGVGAFCLDPIFTGCWHRELRTWDVRTSNVDVYMSSVNVEKTKIMSFSTRYCDKSQRGTDTSQPYCVQNTKMTRSLSVEYTAVNAAGLVRHDKTKFAEFTNEQIHRIAVYVIQENEDYFSEILASPLCQSKTINSKQIGNCKNGDFRFLSANSTPGIAVLHDWYKRYLVDTCKKNEYTYWYIENFCRANIRNGWTTGACSHTCCNDQTDNLDGTPANIQCVQSLSDLTINALGVNTYNEVGYNYLNIVYFGIYNIAGKCTRTKLNCTYDSSVETRFQSSGLPGIGFCPACSEKETCTFTKRSKTYQLVKSNIRINDLVVTQNILPNIKTPTTAKYAYMQLLPISTYIEAPQCNLQSCPANQYKVELYQNLFVCIPCKLVPPKHCSGEHMCRFEAWQWEAPPLQKEHASVFEYNNNTFDTVYTAVRENILALLMNRVVLRPTWVDFLEPNLFTSYNADEVKQGYNDNMENLKGYCTANSNLPVFTNCHNDAPRQRLKSFAETTYKIDDGNVIPSQFTLSWNSKQNQMLHSNIVAWHATQQQSFFEQIFGTEICKKGSISNLICFRDSSTVPPTTLTVNPVLSGNFEVQEGCDVIESDDRIIDSQCNPQACPNVQNNAAYDKYNTFTGTVYTDSRYQTSCRMRSGMVAQYVSTPKSYSTNVCSKQPTRSTNCDIRQGLLGQKTQDGAPVNNVYRRVPLPTTVLSSGLLTRKNSLLALQYISETQVSNVTLDPHDIGGHYIRMKLDSVLSVVGLPLRSYRTMAEAVGITHVDWVSQWQQSKFSELNVIGQLYALQTCRSADCPLRRRFFWSGQDVRFRPIVPNPFRSYVMYESLTHPTTKPSIMLSSLFPTYRTRNGFCVCLDGDSCQPQSGPCSASETLLSLTDLQYRAATVIQPACAQQMDWPYTGGAMRDDSSIELSAQPCGLLDRIPEYLYRYHNSKTVLDNTETTLDEGGDCHMGRPATYNSATQHCTLVEKLDTSIVVNCGTYNVTLARPKSANVNVINRRPCSQCDPLPTFHAGDGTKLEEAEVSYGTLWRWAPSRKLAQDLRFRLCGNDTACAPLDASKLDVGTFWNNMMSGGLTGQPVNSLDQHITDLRPDTEDWSEPWMLCTNDGTALDCQGAASKSDWLRDRSKTCSAIKDLPNANDAVADLTVCDLDETLDNLCRVIQNARYRLFETNCKLSGACRTTNFFYQPATYSISNDQFARQTVQYFYDFAVPNSCPALTTELQAIITQNRKTAQQCSAQSLEMFQIAIGAVRQIVHLFVKISYYMTEIGMNIISLLMASDPNPIIKLIFTNFEALLNEFRQFFMTMGDTFFKMIMETGQLGQFIRNLVLAICEFLKMLVDEVIKPITCFIKDLTSKIIDFFQTVATFFTFGTVNLDYMDGWKQTVEEQFNCDLDNPFHCEKLFPDSDTGPSRLPLPTRCWIGYKPMVGDQRGLGCTPSDTCMDDDGSLIACAACSGGTTMNRYGCDALTKLCRCHTFPIGQTQCAAHHECNLPDAECGFVDAYLQPSFGNVPCARCSNKPLCLVTGSVGHCTCMLRETTHQTCAATYHAQRISPDPTQLCLVSLGLSASSSSAYSSNYRDLASTACANLNGAQTWCLNVWMDGGSSVYMPVGLALLSGRRLLTTGAMAHTFVNWSASYEPCRSVMMASQHSALEEYIAAECERWRYVGERVILIYNVTNASSVQFTSFLGIAEIYMPIEAYFFILKHSDWMQPLAIISKRVARYVRPILNATNMMFQQLQSLPSIQNSMYIVSDLLPWFATTTSNYSQYVENVEYPNISDMSLINDSNNLTLRRRLMTWKDNLQQVQQYSVQIANGNVANLAPDLANTWNIGPFRWPPSYDYFKQQHICLAGSLAFNLSLATMTSTVQYYTKTGPVRPAVDRSFSGAWPQLPGWTGTQTISNEPFIVWYFKDLLKQVLGIDTSFIKRYISSPDYGVTPSPFSEDLSNFIRCDFEKVQHCSGHKRSLFWGGMVVALLCAIISFLGKLFSIPLVDPLLITAYVPMVMLYVFDISIFCMPMVPTCFSSEWVLLMQTIFPTSISWPTQLQHWPGCLDGVQPPPFGPKIIPRTAECFRECTAAPFQFSTWEDNVAWLQCDLGWCNTWFIETYYQPYVNAIPLDGQLLQYINMQRYVDAIHTKKIYLNMPDHREAHRMCCLFTVFNIVPALGAAGVALIVLFALSILSIACVKYTLDFLLKIVIYTHTW